MESYNDTNESQRPRRNLRRKKRAKRKLIILTSIISSVTTLGIVILIIASGVLPISNNSQDEELTLEEDSSYDQGYEDFRSDFRKELEGAGSALKVIRSFYPDQLIAVSDGVYRFADIDESIGLNNYDSGCVTTDDNGLVSFKRGDEICSKQGIDVSSHQGNIDWDKVAADGVEFAFIRACYRGYTNGELYEDEKFEKNVTGAYKAGIPFGIYVFSQATTEDEAIEEANMAISLLDGNPLDLPIVYDVEKIGDDSARAEALGVEERTKIARAFIDTVSAAGYQPAIYFNLEMGAFYLDLKQLNDCPTWFAQYTTDLYWPYNYKYWQYSESGTVNGIKGDVDLDIMFTE